MKVETLPSGRKVGVFSTIQQFKQYLSTHYQQHYGIQFDISINKGFNKSVKLTPRITEYPEVIIIYKKRAKVIRRCYKGGFEGTRVFVPAIRQYSEGTWIAMIRKATGKPKELGYSKVAIPIKKVTGKPSKIGLYGFLDNLLLFKETGCFSVPRMDRKFGDIDGHPFVLYFSNEQELQKAQRFIENYRLPKHDVDFFDVEGTRFSVYDIHFEEPF